jgi:hypothetical protein
MSTAIADREMLELRNFSKTEEAYLVSKFDKQSFGRDSLFYKGFSLVISHVWWSIVLKDISPLTIDNDQ